MISSNPKLTIQFSHEVATLDLPPVFFLSDFLEFEVEDDLLDDSVSESLLNLLLS